MMRVTSRAAKQYAAVDACRSDDLFDLVGATGEDPRTFFNNGIWEGLDFSGCDMSEIQFRDACVYDCIFRMGDISPETQSTCRIFENNKFVDREIPFALLKKGGAVPIDFSGAEDVDNLVNLVRAYNPRTNEELIRTAFAYGARMHEGQFRHSGEPYFSHPVAVAMMLAEQRLDDASIVTALLHDTIEDTTASRATIVEEFGEEIADLVEGVTKLTNLQLASIENKQGENFRQLFMATSKDLRALLVKLSDRLHNMRTIETMRPDKQAQKAHETLDVFGPLAGRMGMHWMRDELEDLAFGVLNPKARSSIIRRFIALKKEGGDIAEKVIKDIHIELEKAGIVAEVSGGARKPYSIWLSMQEKELSFKRLTDVYQFLVLTSTEHDCYRIQGAIHQRWRAVPGRFKDYISQPKSNGYRSLHTTVSGRDGKRMSVLIRTHQMHEIAKGGVAEGLSYRNGLRSENYLAVDPAKWISSLSEQFKATTDQDEFLESTRLQIYADCVFCFTPQGEVIKLPHGATPIDFAYAIHTRIGDACVGAKIDGLRVPLWTRLKNGQSVEIIVAEGQTPQVSWVGVAVTGRARAAIRKALREGERERFVGLGRELARVAFEIVGKAVTEKAMMVVAKRIGLTSGSEVFQHLGEGKISGDHVVRVLYPELDDTHSDEIDRETSVVGLTPDQHFSMASCCQPVPGERIVGISSGKEILLHAIDCFELAKYESRPDRWLDMEWRAGRHAAVHTVSLELAVLNNANILGRVFILIHDLGSNVCQISLQDMTEGFHTLAINVNVRDVQHLETIMVALEAENEVVSVQRHRK